MRKVPERKKHRASKLTNIDDRYNKYVVNGQKAKVNNKYSRVTNKKDVSLMLAPEESKISKISPKILRSEIDESSKRGYNAFIGQSSNEHRSNDSVTYEKLRKFLMED